jgi:hypothetical protein
VGVYLLDTLIITRFSVTQTILQLLFIHSEQKALSEEFPRSFGNFDSGSTKNKMEIGYITFCVWSQLLLQQNCSMNYLINHQHGIAN